MLEAPLAETDGLMVRRAARRLFTVGFWRSGGEKEALRRSGQVVGGLEWLQRVGLFWRVTRA